MFVLLLSLHLNLHGNRNNNSIKQNNTHREESYDVFHKRIAY